MAVPTTGMNEATPAGSDKIREGDDRIREYKIQNREVIEVDHDYPSSGNSATAGQHKQLTLQEQADLGSGAVGATILGSQTVNGKGELVYTDEDDTDIQITSGGKLNAIPSGLISLWSGAISAIPSGWVICDGLNSTPDLTDRFVIHADADAGGTNNVGDSGGSKTHALSDGEMPAHTHSYKIGTDVEGGVGGYGVHSDNTTVTSGSTGSGNPHTNRDKFYALAYIMKT